MGRRTGDLLAPILGVAPGTITMHQNVTVAMGIVASCFRYDGQRRKIVLTELEFPTNMYLFEGFARYGAEIVYVEPGGSIKTILASSSTPSTSVQCSSRYRSCSSGARTFKTHAPSSRRRIASAPA